MFEDANEINIQELELWRDSIRFWVQRVAVPIVTLIGVWFNLINIIVLCQRRMAKSRIHIYLGLLATTDFCYLVMVLLLSLKHYPSLTGGQVDSFWKIVYWKTYPSLFFVCDFCSNTSIWLTVSFTVERYIIIGHPLKGRILFTRSRATKLILILVVCCFILTLPTLFEWKMEFCEIDLPDTNSTNSNSTVIFKARIVNTELGENEAYTLVYHSITLMFFMLLPLTLLTMFNLILIYIVQKSARTRTKCLFHDQNTIITRSTMDSESVSTSSFSERLSQKFRSLRSHQTPSTSTSTPKLAPIALSAPKVSKMAAKLKKKANMSVMMRTQRFLVRQDAYITRLLIAVVIFFIICQTPTAAVLIYTTFVRKQQDDRRREIVVQALNNIANLCVAANAAGNFFLYFYLSPRYKKTLFGLITGFRK